MTPPTLSTPAKQKHLHSFTILLWPYSVCSCLFHNAKTASFPGLLHFVFRFTFSIIHETWRAAKSGVFSYITLNSNRRTKNGAGVPMKRSSLQLTDYTLSLFKFNWTQMWKFLMSREVNHYKSFYLKILPSEKALQSLKDWKSFHMLNLYLCKCLCSTQDLLLRSVYCCLLCVLSLAFFIKLIAMKLSWYWYSGKFSLVQSFV